MKSRRSLTLFALAALMMPLLESACRSDDTTDDARPAPGSTASGGSGTGTGGTSQSGAGTSQSSGGTTSSADPCMAAERTISDLNQEKGDLQTLPFYRMKGVIATSQKYLVSKSSSSGRCLWGVFVTMPGERVEYGSILVVAQGDNAVSMGTSSTCPAEEGKAGPIPNDIAPGDVLDLSGNIDEFLLSDCDGTMNPKPGAGARQFKNATCINVTQKGGPAPAPKVVTDNELIKQLATQQDAELLRKWGGTLFTMQGPFTSAQVMGKDYKNNDAVSTRGDIDLAENGLIVTNTIYYNDLTGTGPKDSTKRYSYPHPATFNSITGIYNLGFCTWSLSVRDRCSSIDPESPSCNVQMEPETSAALCGDTLDNDGDGYVDCEDKDCCSLVQCAAGTYCGDKGGGTGGSSGTGSENTAELCADGQDNDGDKFVDCEDKNCCGVVQCAAGTYCGDMGAGGSSGGSENTAELCADGQDNDGDKFVDCEDKNCCGVVTCAAGTYCGDMGAGGSSGGGENTAEMCADGQDNDGDKFVDCEDKDCCALVQCGPTTYCGKQENTVEKCSDQVDNDGDSYIDCADKGCCGVVQCAPGTYCGDLPP